MDADMEEPLTEESIEGPSSEESISSESSGRPNSNVNTMPPDEFTGSSSEEEEVPPSPPPPAEPLPHALGPNCFQEAVNDGIFAINCFNGIHSQEFMSRFAVHNPQHYEFDNVNFFNWVVTKIMMERRRDFFLLVNWDGYTMLHEAAKKNCIQIAQCIIEKAKEINLNLFGVVANGATPFDLAVGEDLPEMAALLSENKIALHSKYV